MANFDVVWTIGRAAGLAGLMATVVALGACGGGGGEPDPTERALERSRAVAAGEWSYGQDTVPPEQGEREARLVDRCRVTLPSVAESADDAAESRTLDVTCGHVFLGLEPGADSAWVERLVERGRVPGWTTSLGEPVSYLLVRTEPRGEGRILERALASEGVRFVDVREVSRRRP